MNQPQTVSLWLIGSVIFALAAASAIGWFLKRRLDLGLDLAVVDQFHRRVRTYWLMCTILAASLVVDLLFIRQYVTVIVFGLISFWALREFITVTPTRRGDHRGLFWLFFVFTPLQYLFVALDLHVLYSVMIPAVAFLYLAARVAFAGDSKRYLERTAKIQTGLMICVYCLSFAPALLTHDLERRPSTWLHDNPVSPRQAEDLFELLAPPDADVGRLEHQVNDLKEQLKDTTLSQDERTDVTQQKEKLERQLHLVGVRSLQRTLEEEQRRLDALPPNGNAEKVGSETKVEIERKIQGLRNKVFEEGEKLGDDLDKTLPPKPMLVPHQRARLLFFFMLIAQLADVMQYVWGKLVPARVIAPEINASKTWSGFLGGVLSSTVLGALLWWSIDPFKFWEAALLSAVVAAIGLGGGLTMSAIKRDRGVTDFGNLVVGHGGVLDRIDGVCFAAPVFFYLSRYFLWLDPACISPTPW